MPAGRPVTDGEAFLCAGMRPCTLLARNDGQRAQGSVEHAPGAGVRTGPGEPAGGNAPEARDQEKTNERYRLWNSRTRDG